MFFKDEVSQGNLHRPIASVPTCFAPHGNRVASPSLGSEATPCHDTREWFWADLSAFCMTPRAHREGHSFGLISTPRESHFEESLQNFFEVGAFSKTVCIVFEGRSITCPVRFADTVHSIVFRALGAITGYRVKSKSKWVSLSDRVLPMLSSTLQVTRHGLCLTHGKDFIQR